MQALLSPEQCEAIRTVASQVAFDLGVSMDSISAPDATVQMLATDSIWWQEQRAGVCVEIALYDGTCPPRFESDEAVWATPLDASEGVVFDQRARCQRTKGDWKRVLVMNVRCQSVKR